MTRLTTTLIAGVIVTGLLATGCATRGSDTSLGDTDGSSYSASPPAKFSPPPYYRGSDEHFEAP